MEPYIDGTTLVSQDEWNLFIDGLKGAIGEPDITALKDALIEAILSRAKLCTGPIGLFFSGGVDSTFIAWVLKKNDIPFTCYTVGFQDEGTKEPEDIVESKNCAQELDFEQKIVLINLEQAEELFEKTKKLLPEEVRNPITIGVGSVVVAAAEAARADGITEFFGGLGSEEIFAGYQRHEQAEDVQEECWAGLKTMYERDLIRDCALAKGLHITVHTPFLDEKVILETMAIPDSEKINIHKGIEQKKYCLRVIAEDIGLPAVYAWRPKRAAQYGSRTDSALDKLARKKGLSKKEYCS